MRVARRYPHPVEKVWRAVTTSEHLGAWFPSPVDIDLRPGGTVRFRAFEGDAGATGTVEEVVAPHRLAFTWGSDRMTFELEPDGDGTSFTLTHAFDDTAGAASFATGWELCLVGLRSVLADEPAPPPDRGIARHEAAGPRVRARPARGDGVRRRLDRPLRTPADVPGVASRGTSGSGAIRSRASSAGRPPSASR